MQITTQEKIINELIKRKKTFNHTNATLAEVSGVDASTICRVLTSKTSPKLRTLLKITAALEMELSYEFTELLEEKRKNEK